jgi:predicted CoA-binding protein
MRSFKGITSDEELRRILRDTRVIAMVGASPRPERDSYGVMRYLQQQGYRVIPVNPTVEGETIHGETIHASLADIRDAYQLVDVFRRSDAVSGIVDEILALDQRATVRSLWLQLGVIDTDAASRAADAGLDVVMDRCLKVEHRRLL